ncbi:MAG: restriction endonuclease subunit S [Methanosphaera sp.]|nr:restriction endonuclease subunit S [Methanosphaera sp.]MBR0471640.1 restriction endonuclease subunit S [Methanosphaera sp.]
MENEITIKKLGEIADVITGVRLTRFEKGKTIPQQAIIHKSITDEYTEIIPEIVEANQEIDNKYLTQENDIIYKLQGTPLGKRITNETGLIVSHSFAIIRTKDAYSPTYLENFLQYPTIQKTLQIIANESMIPQINTKTLKNLKIILPNSEKQEEYAKIANLIDLRIKTNQKQIMNDKNMKISIINKIIGDNHD